VPHARRSARRRRQGHNDVLLIIDNYDSFTYNIVQYIGELGAEPVVHRNDTLSVSAVLELAPDAIIISPGPCTPSEAGISVPLVRAAAEAGVPLLGVCLGHQAIGEALGGKVVRASRLMHGKTTEVRHDGQGVFAGIPDPFTVMRYHSLVIEPGSLPGELLVSAWSTDRPQGEEIMAVRHRTRPIQGVQFHPESVGTEHGKQLLANFLTSVVALR
jgi:anthranilate synthase/aminodeoxychorismate synthase-like glutamine amidotransferase